MLKELVEKLLDLGKTISTMESCTGGGVANAITNIAGASEVLKFSAVTYSNEFKIKMGVSSEIIDKYSVYSMETAEEMSKNISVFTNSDFGVGITGKLNSNDSSNPEGENDIVFVSIYDKEKDKYYNTTIKVLVQSREKNKELIITKINDLILEILNQ
ncbi:MAG: nicotinamide-nucleotide amidohydrolase family protein [Bacilli bacterium]|nr:nicotinamide-nucleotide amidohydrolase family protein [Bacilli bacterium]